MGNQLRSCCKNEDNIDNKLKEDNKEENDDLETGSNNGEDNDIKDKFSQEDFYKYDAYIANIKAEWILANINKVFTEDEKQIMNDIVTGLNKSHKVALCKIGYMLSSISILTFPAE